ncbi:fimbrin [Thecamonas trahens ATCC 50062]|uniref:Fimbrin n=1 Tax=Thecamonas trahens ATCC 50062 TaxID=461836 RepID=A0A0L0D352_THETB|nr:fimbrin [Thecamonas trahens ATCC 50062]KNC46585.1 fimbrin [Thecamonas trahens ATCC 50062]|eukprot:XP_013760361.1 fimbrin [Thecamonas trahens ATCC 50062]
MAALEGMNKSLFAEVDPAQAGGQEVTVKVTLQKYERGKLDERTKSMRFNNAMYVDDVCKQVAEAFRMDDSPQFALWNDGGGVLEDSYFLKREQTLRFYDIVNLDELTYKSKMRPLRVELMDGSIKTVMIDMSAPTKDLVALVCEKNGIANPAEFAFQVSLTEEQKEAEAKRQKEVAKIRAKAGLDTSFSGTKIVSKKGIDEDWLSADQTLAQCGVLPEYSVLLKKKFFFSDASVDTSDPLTLSLLFNQYQDDVANGNLPVARDEAILLAALSAQVTLGDHAPGKHTVKKIDFGQWLPEEYRKEGKKTFKEVLAAHAKIRGTKADAAKFRFVQLIRSLETFGISTYHVQEPIRSKKTNKLTKKFQPVILGVSKSHLYRFDPIEKKSLSKPFALTQLRRWAPSDTSLTLDFGDHDQEYYTVLTEEGRAIAALISGYIDLILSQRRDREKEIEDDQQTIIMEETIAPSNAHAITKTTSGVFHRMDSSSVLGVGSVGANRLSAARGSSAVSVRKLDKALKLSVKALQSADRPVEPYAGDENMGETARERAINLQSTRDMLDSILAEMSSVSGDVVSAAGVTSADRLKKYDLLESSEQLVALADDLRSVLASRSMADAGLDELADGVTASLVALLQAADLAAKDVAKGNAGASLDQLLKAAGDLSVALQTLSSTKPIPGVDLASLLAAASDLNSALDSLIGAPLTTADPALSKPIDDARSAVVDYGRHTVALSALATASDASGIAKLRLQGLVLDDALSSLVTAASIDGVSPVDMQELLRLAGQVSDALGALRAATDSDPPPPVRPVLALSTLVAADRAAAATTAALDALDDAENDEATAAATAALAGSLAPLTGSDPTAPFSLATLAAVPGVDAAALASLMSTASSLATSLASLTAEMEPAALDAAAGTLGSGLESLAKDSRKAKILAARGVADSAAALLPLAQREAEAESNDLVKAELVASSAALSDSLGALQAAITKFEETRSDADLAAVTAAALAVGAKSDALNALRASRQALLILATEAKAATLAASNTRTVLVTVDSAIDTDALRTAKRAASGMAKPNAALGDSALYYEAEPHGRESQTALLDAVAAALPAYAETNLAIGTLTAAGFHNPGEEYLLSKAKAESDERVTALVKAFNAAKAANWLYDVSAALKTLQDSASSVAAGISALSAGTFGAKEDALDADTRASRETVARRSASDGIDSTVAASAALSATLQLLSAESPAAAASGLAAVASRTIAAILDLLAVGETKGGRTRATLDAAAGLVSALIAEVELTQEAGIAALNRYDGPTPDDAAAVHDAALDAAAELRGSLPGSRGCAEALAHIQKAGKPVLAVPLPGDATASAAAAAATAKAAADAAALASDADADEPDAPAPAVPTGPEYEYEFYEVTVMLPAKPPIPAKPQVAPDPKVVPAPWEAFYDDSHGRYYYVSSETGATTWEQPPMPAPPPIPAKPTTTTQRKKRRVRVGGRPPVPARKTKPKVPPAPSPVVVAAAAAVASANAVEPMAADGSSPPLDEDASDALGPRAVALASALQGLKLASTGGSGAELDDAAYKVTRAYPQFADALMAAVEKLPEGSARRVNASQAAKAVTRLAAASVVAAQAVNADRGDADAALALEQTTSLADVQLRALMSALMGDDARGLDDFTSLLEATQSKNAEIAQMRKVLDSAEASSAEGSAQVQALMSEIESLNGKLAESKSKFAAAEAERRALEEKAQGETRQQIEGYQHEIATLKERVAELEAELAALRAQLAEKEGLSHEKLNEMTAERDDALDEVARLKQELADERAARAKLEELAPELKAQLAEMQAKLEAEKMAFKKKLAEQADFALEGADAKLIEFINSTLASDPHVASLLPMNPRAVSVATAAADGVLLCKYLNAMMPGSVDERVINFNISDEDDVLMNQSLVINTARAIGCPALNVTPKALYTGKVPQILSLLWDITRAGLLAVVNVVRHPELFELQASDEEVAAFSRLPPEVVLVRWVNHHAVARGAPAIDSFADLADGVALVHLLNALEPSTGLGALAQGDPEARAGVLLQAASGIVGNFSWVTPADVAGGNVRLLLFFVASLFSARTGLTLTEEMELALGDFDEAELQGTAEERAYLAWIGAKGVEDVHDLKRDFMDGIKMLELEDKVEPGIVTWDRVNRAKDGKSLHVVRKVENANLAVTLGRDLGLVLVGIDGKDLVDGSQKLTMAVIWQLLRYDLLRSISSLSYGGRAVSEQDVWQWAVSKVRASGKPVDVKSFKDRSLSSGLFLIDLLAACNPRAIDYSMVEPGLTPEEKEANAKLVLGSARRLGASHYLVPEHITSVDPKMLLMLVGTLMEATAKRKGKKK